MKRKKTNLTRSATDELRTAAKNIEERASQRDQPQGERSMARAVNAFNALFGDSVAQRGHMTETEGWEFMSLLKKSRAVGGAYHADDYSDDTAYCALAAEAASKQADRAQ